MAKPFSVRKLWAAGRYYDGLNGWLVAITKAGKLSHPDYPTLERVYNALGTAVARARDAVATAIIRENKGAEPWASLAQALPFIQYNTAEYVGDLSPLAQFRRLPIVNAAGDLPIPVGAGDNMTRTLPKWTDAQAATIAAALPPSFDSWMDAIEHAIGAAWLLVDRIMNATRAAAPPASNLAPSPPAAGTAATAAPGDTSSKGKGVILAALGLGLLLFMPRKRRRSN